MGRRVVGSVQNCSTWNNFGEAGRSELFHVEQFLDWQDEAFPRRNLAGSIKGLAIDCVNSRTRVLLTLLYAALVLGFAGQGEDAVFASGEGVGGRPVEAGGGRSPEGGEMVVGGQDGYPSVGSDEVSG